MDAVQSLTPPPSRPEPLWRLLPPAPPQEVYRLSRELGIPPILAGVLWSRGLQGDVQSELQPPLEPTRIRDLPAAVARLALALERKERIVVHGDYDADGISGTAVLTLGLRALGANVTPFLPNRLTEGYGISPERLSYHSERADLFVSVDCGISNLVEVAALQRAGVDVIVTDHHQPGEELPDCLIVHPRVPAPASPIRGELTGAGVAFHLLWGLHGHLGVAAPLDFSDLASIGTIADVGVLQGENRALVQEGLARFASSRWPGLRAMVALSRLSGGVRAKDVAFVIAPRLNAAGRLGQAELGLELLTTSSERRARELAVYLDTCNAERRKIQDAMLAQALELADPSAPALVVCHPGWHAGVMGIVASKLVERFYKPVFIIAGGKGSVRSIEGVSAVGCLRHASRHLLRFGGHKQAAGFAIREEHIPAFRDSVFEYVERAPSGPPVLEVDAVLSVADIDQDLFDAICGLEPYGEGYPSPRFALVDSLESARAVGKDGRHLQLRLGGLKGVAWQRGGLAAGLARGSSLDLVVSLQQNDWQGKTSIEFVAEELRESRPLSFAGPEHPGRIHRGALPGHAGRNPVVLNVLPLDAEKPLALCAPLERLVEQELELVFDLEDAELQRLLELARQFPSVAELRRAFVCLQHGRPLPWSGVKAQLATAALGELDLLDARGFARRGVRRDPYESNTLVTGLVEGYKLRSFVKAYLHLDEASFAQTVQTLFS